MLVRPTAILTEETVIQILELLKQKVPHRIIAQRFSISKKTISRINTGETWRDVSLRYGSHPPVSVTMPSVEFYDLHDEITAVKNHFALSFQQPIHWGWFESWDGLHSLASDGHIIWESTGLVKYAQKIAATQLPGSPVWADKAKELPTFELQHFMSHPIGELASTARMSFLHRKYVNVATKMKLEIREAGPDSVYFCRIKSKRDSTPSIIACIHL